MWRLHILLCDVTLRHDVTLLVAWAHLGGIARGENHFTGLRSVTDTFSRMLDAGSFQRLREEKEAFPLKLAALR